MIIELSNGDVETLMESLSYSKKAISERIGTPETVRRENLSRLDIVLEKLRAAKRKEKSSTAEA